MLAFLVNFTPIGFNSPFYQMMLSHLALDPDSKGNCFSDKLCKMIT